MQTNDNQNDNQDTTSGHLGKKVRKLFRPDRASPYLVQFGSGAERRTESYASAVDRNRRYNELVKELGSGGGEPVMTKRDRQEYAAIKATIGDTPWTEVVGAWRAYAALKGQTISSLTVDAAVEKYLAETEKRVDAGTLATGTAAQKRHKMRLFLQAFAGKRMSEIKSAEIEDWLNDTAGPVAGTFNSYKKHIGAFFEAFRKEIRPNPMEEIEAMDNHVDNVEVLTPRQTAQLFGYALQHRPDALGRLALEAFCGMRFGSAYRITKGDINFSDKGILLPGHIVKTRRRFYIDGLPDNLWAWLAKTNDACWALENNQWMHLKSSLFVKAGVPHPRNCLRHSFATYHVAAFKDPGKTAAVLCHRDQALLWRHYNGIATQAAGKQYFSITPDNWREIAV
jgi:integrase